MKKFVIAFFLGILCLQGLALTGFNPDYEAALKKAKADFNAAVQAVLANVTADMSQLEMEKYFHDYLEYLSADMPSVEQWTEPLSAAVHYRWCPQKDCFYLDENIDDYLREVYEFVRR